MSEHVKEWLGAYLDGELASARQREVENHLAVCAQCQEDLDQLSNLSALLHEGAPQGNFMPTERFVSNLNLNLPRRNETAQSHNILEIGWWLIPLGVMGVWAFLQVTFLLSNLVMGMADAGLLGSSAAWLQGNPAQAEWFSAAQSLFGSQIGYGGQMALATLNRADLFLQDLTGRFVWQLVLALVYLGWMAAWWLRAQGQMSGSENMAIQS